VSLQALPDDLETPCVVVDRATMDANIERLQSALDARGIRNRPHAKTHKSVRIGRLQVDAGAAGLTVGTLGEAEVFAAGGITDLFIAYPLWFSGSKGERLRALTEVADLRVGVDSVEGATTLAAAVKGVARPPRALVEVDSGGHRTGVEDPALVVEIARAVSNAGLEVEGVFTHGGHAYALGAAEAAAADETTALAQAAEALRRAGFEPRTISSGTTPTRLLAGTPVNEVRAGTYVFGDRQQVSLGAAAEDEVALVVAATVVSVHLGRFVIDAGAKSLTKDRPEHLAGYGLMPAYPDVVIDRLSDYHGTCVVPNGGPAPRLGEVVAIVPNHVCPVVDLFDELTVVSAGGGTERWPVDARGRSR
jgi:D-serine deaminase-like pyridoxal phosphate-dependent protein